MILIEELIQLSPFADFHLVAGAAGLEREMESIVILEYESYRDNYEVFDEKDFVLSSLFFAKDDPKLIVEAVERLLQREVAGIAIKTVFFEELPEEAIALAEKKNVPIFLFRNAYMEDLIISANELLQSKLQYVVLEEKVRGLLERRPTEQENERISYEINPYFEEHLAAAYLRPKKRENGVMDEINFRRLTYKRFQAKGSYDHTYVKYRDGMFLIFSVETRSENIERHLQDLLKKMELDAKRYDIGIVAAAQPRNHLHLLLEQAMFANRVCQIRDAEIVNYAKIGSYQFIVPLLSQQVLKEGYEEKIELLRNYDEVHSSDLLHTLEVFVERNGEIAKTAEELFQHPNTVRYRLKKAGSLLECEERDFYVYVTILIRMYQLKNYSKI